jgi:hypothetical protein
LRRNTVARGRKAGFYETERAEQKTVKRHQDKLKLMNFYERKKEYAVQILQEIKWSPELISKKATETGNAL